MDPTTEVQQVLMRLFPIALQDSGQSRRVADFLLAWHNAADNGGWDPADFWNVDDAVADDLLAVLRFLRQRRQYPDDLGFQHEMQRVWTRWRGPGR